MRFVKWIITPLVIAAIAACMAYYTIEWYIMKQAEKDVRDVLLSHRGVHLYIQYTMHPEFYRARDNEEIPLEYYAPEVLSSSYIVRVLHNYYNNERLKAGLPPIYYKLAADNPRNPVNRADSTEVLLLKYFRENPKVREYRKVSEIKGKTYFVFAMPFLRTEQRCMVCHSTRDKAPVGVQSRYPGNGGYGDSVGNLRAIESLRVPIDQEKIAIQVASIAVLVGVGAITGLYGFSRNLRQAVTAKTQELASKEISSRRLLEASRAIPFEYLPSEDRFSLVGHQYRAIFCDEPEHLKSRADFDALVDPRDRESKLTSCWHSVERSEDHKCELRMISHDKRHLVIEVTINIVSDGSTESKVVGFMQDVTEAKRLETIRKARMAIVESALMDTLEDLMKVVIDEVEYATESQLGFFHQVQSGERHLTLTQWSSRTLKSCESQVTESHYPIEQAGVWADSLRYRKAIIHNDYYGMSGKAGLPEGHVALFRELVVPIFNGPDIIALIGVGNKPLDYTETDINTIEQIVDIVAEIIRRKQAEAETKRSQEYLLQAQKVEAIGRLAGGVAHDFNNMLGVILGHTEIATMKIDKKSAVSEDLEEIKKAAERSASITRQLLAFARKQIASPRILDINATIEGMLKMLRRLIGEEIELYWKPSANLGSIKIDPSQVDQLLANLMTNARDAIAGVGSVTVETANVEFDDIYLKSHPDSAVGHFVMLAVSDTGCGIPKEIQSRIFEPFYTTKEVGRGTGLGLATVYGIVKQNGGFINVYSEPNHGTTFKIYLPRVETEAVTSEQIQPVASADLSGSSTILIVEDEGAILELANRILTNLGYNVLTAKDPGEALHVAATHGSPIALLITDVVLPMMNGREMADKIAVMHPDMKILFMSGYTSEVMLNRGILDNEVNFLPKPFSLQEFSQRVKQLLQT